MRQSFTIKAFKKLIWTAAVLLLCACSNVAYSEKNPQYLYTYCDENNSKEVFVEMLDEDLKTVYREKINTPADISYVSYTDGILYMHGPGGFYQFDVSDRGIQKLSDKDVGDFFRFEEGIIYVENVGFQQNDGYRSNIYLNETFLFSVDYAVNSLYVDHQKIYVTNLPHSEKDENYYTFVYDQNGQLLDRRQFDDSGTVMNIQNNICYVTNKGYTNIATNEQFDFHSSLFSPYPILDSTNGIHIADWDFINLSCRLLDETRKQIEWERDCKMIDYSGNGILILRTSSDEYVITDVKNDKEKVLSIPDDKKSLGHLFLISQEM